MTMSRFLPPLAALLPLVAAAQSLELRWDEVHYDAAETIGGFVLNRDRGSLRGPALQAAVDASGARFALEASQWRGTPGYDGFTQIGLPLSTGTELRWRHAQLRIEPAKAWSAVGLDWQPALLLGTQQVRRAILASAISLPTTETLHRQSAGVALALERPLGAVTLGAAAQASWPWRQRLDVDTYGALDRYSLEPQGGRAGALTLMARAPLPRGWSVSAQLAREMHEFGASASALVTRGGQPAAISVYPGSVQRVTRAGLALQRDLN